MKPTHLALFSELTKQKQLDAQNVWDRRLQWSLLEKRIYSHFQAAKLSAKQANFYDNLYIAQTTDKGFHGEYYDNFNSISLCMGSRHTGVNRKVYELGNLIEHNVILEKGGSITFGQDIAGHVHIFLSPLHSTLHNDKKEPQFYKAFIQPLDVKDENISKAIKHGIRFLHDTSYTGHFGVLRRVKLFISKHKRDFLFTLLGVILSSIFSEVTPLIRQCTKLLLHLFGK